MKNLFKLRLDNIIFFLFLALFLSRLEVFIIPIRGQKPLMFLIFLLSIYILFSEKILGVFLKRGKQIIFVIIYLLMIYLLGFGDHQDLSFLLSVYLSATSFFIIGLYFGKKNKEQIMKRFFLTLFVLTFLNLIPFVINMLLTGNISKFSLAEFYNLGKLPMIMFWPFIFIIGFVGFNINIYDQKKNIYKYFMFFLALVFCAAIIVSSYTAVFLMLLFSAFSLFFVIRRNKFTFLNLTQIFLVLSMLILLINSVRIGFFGNLGGTTLKISSLFEAYSSTNNRNLIESIDFATGTRFSLLEITFKNIAKSPLFGNGYYFTSVKNSISTQVASGHSSLLDFISYFGIFSLLFYNLFMKFIFASYKLATFKSYLHIQIAQTFFAVLLTYFLISFANPYLQFNTIDLIFLIGGWSFSKIDNIAIKK